MKRPLSLFLCVTLLILSLTGCAANNTDSSTADNSSAPSDTAQSGDATIEGTAIVLSDEGITVDGETISSDETAAVYAANDIVFYPEGKDFTYGEGTNADAHSQAEADAHTVVHITKAGTYVISGTLSAGQIAVDLGEEAEEDPSAVVTLILNGVDITCTVAPAVIFYNVYECSSSDEEGAVMDVDTSAAGANVIIADSSTNTVTGSYVARIYKPDTVELSEDGTEVADAKKLHKYDAAFYSKKTMNVSGGSDGTGILNINAENEGLDSELHLTINSGNINITSGNDGINTNEDYVSVTTVNGGNLTITVSGQTGEGDGIDSNGWLVINGGTVTAAACSTSGDSGIDADNGVYVNGGTVIATGNMFDRLAGEKQNYAVFTFSQRQSGGSTYTLKNADGTEVLACAPVNDFTYLVVSSPDLTSGEYTFWQGEQQLAASSGGMMGGFGGMGDMMPPEDFELPEGSEPPEVFENMTPPEGFEPMQRPEGMEGFTPPDGFDPTQRPEGMEPPEGMELPDGFDPSEGMERPQGGGRQPGMGGQAGEISTTFSITDGANFFSNVSIAQ